MNKATFLVAIATGFLGLATGVIGTWFSYVSKGEELQVRMIELAVKILSEKPVKELMALRAWAVDVIDRNSDVQLPQDAKAALKEYQLLAACGAGHADGQSDVRGAGAVIKAAPAVESGQPTVKP